MACLPYSLHHFGYRRRFTVCHSLKVNHLLLISFRFLNLLNLGNPEHDMQSIQFTFPPTITVAVACDSSLVLAGLLCFGFHSHSAILLSPLGWLVSIAYYNARIALCQAMLVFFSVDPLACFAHLPALRWQRREANLPGAVVKVTRRLQISHYR